MRLSQSFSAYYEIPESKHVFLVCLLEGGGFRFPNTKTSYSSVFLFEGNCLLCHRYTSYTYMHANVNVLSMEFITSPEPWLTLSL